MAIFRRLSLGGEGLLKRKRMRSDRDARSIRRKARQDAAIKKRTGDIRTIKKTTATVTSTRKLKKPTLSVSTKETVISPKIRKISKLKLGIKKVITDLKNKTMALIDKKRGFFSGISGGITFGKDQLKQFLPFVIIGAIVIVVGVGVGRMLAKKR